jgi:DNA topoisomerase-1
VHPEILNTYLGGSLLLEIKEEVEAELREDLEGLKPEEAAVMGLLRNRLAKDAAANEQAAQAAVKAATA